MNSSKNIKYDKLIYAFILIVACVSGVIWAFTNVGIDVTYQISMTYRFIKGDIPFLEMWEPHQTSIFINVPLVWLFNIITGSVDGIVLFLQIVGIIIRAAVSFYTYKTICGVVPKPISFGAAVCLFMVSPKDYAIPEFGNMQLWFSTLLFCFLCRYISGNKRRYIVYAAVSTCLLALSYPSCVIVYVPVVVLVAIYGGEEKKRDIVIYSIICIVSGVLFSALIVSKLGVNQFLDCVAGILSLEPSHTISPVEKFVSYIKDLGQILLCVAVVCGLALIIERLITKVINRGNKEKAVISISTLLALILGIYDIFFCLNILSAENRCAYGIVFINSIIIGLVLSKEITEEKKIIYVIGTSISLTGLFATFLLTDLSLIVSMAYAILAVGMSFIPMYAKCNAEGNKKAKRWLTVVSTLFLLLLFFRAAYIRTPIVGRGQIFVSSWDELSLVRSGPAKGIITNQNSSARERDGYIDFRSHITSKDKVLIIDGLVNSLAYMYTNAEIATPSVMSDNHFTRDMLKYYEINPNKYPNVLAVASYGGELDYEVRANQWIYEWIMNEFGATRTEQGTYWTFFYR